MSLIFLSKVLKKGCSRGTQVGYGHFLVKIGGEEVKNEYKRIVLGMAIATVLLVAAIGSAGATDIIDAR